MSKLFGEYLVEAKLIRVEQLLEALIHQLRSSPSTAEVLFDEQLLPAAKQLKILNHQQTHGLDYRSSAKDLGLWNSGLAEKVSDSIRKKRRPIGEILVSLGHLPGPALTKALEAYIESYSNPGPSVVSAPRETKAVDTERLPAALCGEYADNFEKRIAPALRQLMGELAGGLAQGPYKQAMDHLIFEIAALKAGAVFLGAKRSEEIASEILSTLSLLKSSPAMAAASDLVALIKTALHVFSSIAQLLRHVQSEEDMNSDVNLKDLMLRLATLLSRLRDTAGQKVA